VVVTHQYGGNERMFGSDVEHSSRIVIEIHEAELHRRLSNDNVYPHKTICKLAFSEAQWAAFVSSSGLGVGTPCTLQRVTDGIGKSVPAIDGDPSQTDMFKQEMAEQLRQRMKAVDEQLRKVDELIIKGKARKTELADIRETLRSTRDRLVSDSVFVVDQFDRHVEKSGVAAKIQIESFASHYAMRLGFDMAKKGHRLPQNDLIEGSPE
jgi:hypothetical protein